MTKLSSKLISVLALARGGETDKALHEMVNMTEAGGEDAVTAKIMLQTIRSFGAMQGHGAASARAFKATPPTLVADILKEQGFSGDTVKEIMGKKLLLLTRGTEEVYLPHFEPKAEETAAA